MIPGMQSEAAEQLADELLGPPHELHDPPADGADREPDDEPEDQPEDEPDDQPDGEDEEDRT